MAIDRIKVRARVEIGSIRIETPFVQSFNVTKQRGQVSTFSASLKVSNDEISGVISGGDVRIYAGEDSPSDVIFTGICRAAKTSPCYDDPKYVILSISGADKMSLLHGKKYTRRCRSTSTAWAAITGVVREGLKSGKFARTNEPTLEMDDGELERDRKVVATVGTKATDQSPSKPKEPPSRTAGNPKAPQVTINESIPVGGE